MKKVILIGIAGAGLYYLTRKAQARPGLMDRPDIQSILDRLSQIPERASEKEKRVLSYLPEISAAASQFRIQRPLIAAMIDQESAGVWNARGRDAEYGLMQILCPTAEMRVVGYQGACEGLLDPAVNIWYSTKYLRYQMDRYAGKKMRDWWAVAAYNAGTAELTDGKFKNQRYVDSLMGKRLSRYTYLISQLEKSGLAGMACPACLWMF